MQQSNERETVQPSQEQTPFVRLPLGKWAQKLNQGGKRLVTLAGWSASTVALVLLILAILSSHALLPAKNSRLAVGAVVHVSPGSTSADIARLLEREKMLKDARVFMVISRVLNLDSKLQAGDYLFSPGMNVLQMVQRLKSGNVATKKVTVREGMNLTQIASTLERNGLVDAERFLELARDERLVYGDRSPITKPIPSLEGYLYPDTYVFALGQSEEEIIKKMVKRFVEVAVPVLEEADKKGYSVHELVTLASIVEKEAMVDRERPVISGVFHNRLEINMPLQSDPTVQYVMDKPRPKLYYKDLAIDSKYNTYKYAGLPPGPISSPGLQSLEAAGNPADVRYLYFVARGDGTHVFSRTFAEHVNARRRVGW